MADKTADGSSVEGSPEQRARVRKRNLIAVGTSVGLLALALACVLLLVTGFSQVGTSAKPKAAKKKVVKVAKTTTTKAPPPTTSTSTTVFVTTTTSTTSTTTTTTTTVAPAVTVPPATAPPATAPPATAPPAMPTASVSVSNSPRFCNVTVRLSSGEQLSYPLDGYLQNPGDMYVFTATLGRYAVDVTTSVVAASGGNKCTPTLSNLRRY
jgi:hypothetical protein